MATAYINTDQVNIVYDVPFFNKHTHTTVLDTKANKLNLTQPYAT